MTRRPVLERVTPGWSRSATVERGLTGVLHQLLALSCDWYWQADAQGLLNHVEGKVPPSYRDWLTKRDRMTLLDWPEMSEDDGSSPTLREALLDRVPFADRTLVFRDQRGHLRYLSISGEPIFGADGRFAGFRGTAKDVTARRRTESLAILEQAVTRSLAEAATSRKILQAVMRVVCETEDWQSAGFFKVIDDDGTTRLTAGWSGPGVAADVASFYATSLDRLIPPGGALSSVIATRQPRLIVDMTDLQTSWSQRVRTTAERATLFCPVLVDGRVNGVFAFASREVRQPDERLLETIQRIGEQVGQFMKRKEAEQILRQSEERFRALTDLSSDCYWETDRRLRIVRVEGHREKDGIRLWAQQLVGRHFRRVGLRLEGDRGQPLPALTREAFRDVAMSHGEGEARRHLSVSGEPIFDHRRRFAGYRGVGRDITDRRRAEQRIQHLATHDELTGLPNRALFGDILVQAIEHARPGELALLFVDLDRFKSINDTLGHDAGDELLKQMARRLRTNVRDGDRVARLGGDEFVVLLFGVDGGTGATKVARTLLAAIAQPLLLTDGEHRITASIGISLNDAAAPDGRSLMRNADLAMYAAKRGGKDSCHLYTPELQTEAARRLSIERLLRTALERDEFVLVYQPKVELATGRIVGAEALLRWNNPELGWVAPDVFIPVAEETGQILPIGRWVLRQACGQQAAWHAEGLAGLSVAVNLSARQFVDEFLVGDVACALREAGLAPCHLELEITEGAAIQNVDRSVKVLEALRRMGVRIAIDDFGTGYSSLGQLKRFPIDTLKIDRSFVSDIPGKPAEEALVSAVIAMGRALGLTTVAEGVETEAQRLHLQAAGCDQMQGFLFSRPIAPEAFGTLARSAA